MAAWIIAAGLVAVAGIAGVLYGLHRLALNLEERGLLYYKHRQPQGSASRCLVPLQQAIEPPAQHVIEAEEQHAPVEEESGDPARQRRARFSPLDSDGEHLP